MIVRSQGVPRLNADPLDIHGEASLVGVNGRGVNREGAQETPRPNEVNGSEPCMGEEPQDNRGRETSDQTDLRFRPGPD